MAGVDCVVSNLCSSIPLPVQRQRHFEVQLLYSVSSTDQDMDLHECPHGSIKGVSNVAAQMLQLADLSRACSCLSSGCCGQSSSSAIAMMRCGLQPCCRPKSSPSDRVRSRQTKMVVAPNVVTWKPVLKKHFKETVGYQIVTDLYDSERSS